MGLKKEPSGRRSIQVEVEVPGSPEEVWKAIATGPGISAWFVPTRFEDGPDGKPKKLISTFGPGMDCAAEITEWNPPRHFAADTKDYAPGAPTMATEWTVEARGGGKCIVRVVHSLFASTDDWDGQLEGTESGWPVFFRILEIYLSKFRGQKSALIQAMAFAQGEQADAWGVLLHSLGAKGLKAGQRVGGAAGGPRLSGVVDYVKEDEHHRNALLVLDEPTSGVAFLGVFSCGGPTQAMVSMYLYGDRAEAVAQRDRDAWQGWLQGMFPQG